MAFLESFESEIIELQDIWSPGPDIFRDREYNNSGITFKDLTEV
jgi:hypothetical protein